MKKLLVVFVFSVFCVSAHAENKTKSIKDLAETYCIDVPYGRSNSTPVEIQKTAKMKISSMKADGLVPLASEGPTVTVSEKTSQICIRAIATRSQPVELF